MKKLISIILSVMLIMSTLPMIASAETTLDSIVVSQDCPVRRGTDAKKNLNLEKDGYNWSYANQTTYCTPIYYSFKLPEIPEGETVTKAMFKLHFKDTTNVAGATTFQFRFYPVNSAWDQTTLTFNNQPLTITGHFPDEEPVLTYNIPINAKDSSKEYDIAPLVRQYLASGADYDFSFAVLTYIANGTTNGAANIYSLENADESLRPTLTLTTDTISATELQSISVEDGVTITPADEVEFTFNNEIDKNSVDESNFAVTDFAGDVVEISDDDISVSGATVSLSKQWDAYGAYTVSLSGISDIYGKAVASGASVSFKVNGGDNLVSSNLVVEKTLKMLSTSSGIEYTESTDTTGASKYSMPVTSKKQTGYIVFRFDLSNVDTTKYLSDAQLIWYDDYDWKGIYHVYQIPAGTWTGKADVTTEYYDAVDAATKDASNLVTSYEFNYDNKRSDYKNQVSVASQLATALKNGETSVAFTVVHDASNTIYTHSIYHEGNGSYRPTISLTTAEPSFDVISSVPEKGGVMDGIIEPVEMAIATAPTDETATADYIKLVKASDNSEVAVNVTFDKALNKLIVTPENELEERTAYKVIFKAGLADNFGNVLDEDKIANAFTTGTALEFYGIKFTSEESPVYDTCEEIENFAANSTVTAVAKIKNNSSSDLNAVMIIAIYGDDDSLIAVDAYGGKSCAPANEETQYAKTITVPEDAEATKIKAFIWDGFNYIRPVFDHVEINQAQ